MGKRKRSTPKEVVIFMSNRLPIKTVIWEQAFLPTKWGNHEGKTHIIFTFCWITRWNLILNFKNISTYTSVPSTVCLYLSVSESNLAKSRNFYNKSYQTCFGDDKYHIWSATCAHVLRPKKITDLENHLFSKEWSTKYILFHIRLVAYQTRWKYFYFAKSY